MRCYLFLLCFVMVLLGPQAATKKFESEVFAESYSPLVTCAMNMMAIMVEVEPLLQ